MDLNPLSVLHTQAVETILDRYKEIFVEEEEAPAA
jgi:hypothetical protein